MTGVGEVGSSIIRRKKRTRNLSAADKDVVHGDVDCQCVSKMCRVQVENPGELTQLDNEANSTHHQETDTNSLADLDELSSVG